MKAYGVGMDQISGPDWIQTERYSNMYSVVAKIPPNTTEREFHLMLQNLLAERFHLTLHHETREFQVYSLLVAEGGPKMKPSSPDADAKAGQDQFRLDSKGFPLLRPGERVSTATGSGPLYGSVHSTHRQTMAQFAATLGPMVNMSNGEGIVRGSPPPAHVVDRTGLTGEFDFTLEFAGAGFPANSPLGTPADEWPGPTLFAALEKQLGLKLEKTKAKLDVLVIDHADKIPTEN
jgi:uncharacterized protein (TIGR03435 family)